MPSVLKRFSSSVLSKPSCAAVQQILDLDVFVEVHEIPAARMRKHGIGMRDLAGTLGFQGARALVAAARMRGRFRAGIASVLAACGVVVNAIHAARCKDARR